MNNRNMVLIIVAVVVIAAIAGTAILKNDDSKEEGAPEITYTEPGTYTGIEGYETITITSANVTIEDATAKRLVITKDVGDGDVYIVNSIIENMEVYGGGTNSIHVKGNTTISDSIVRKSTGDVRLVTDDGAKISKVTVPEGSRNVRLEGNITDIDISAKEIDVKINTNSENLRISNTAEKVSISLEQGSNLTNVDIQAKEVNAKVESSIGNLKISSDAEGSKLSIGSDAKVTDLSVDAKKSEIDVKAEITNLSITSNAEESRISIMDTASVNNLTIDSKGVNTTIDAKVDSIKVESNAEGSKITVDSNAEVKEVGVGADSVNINANSSIGTIQVSEGTTGTTVEVSKDAGVGSIETDSPISIKGEGNVDKVVTDDKTLVNTEIKVDVEDKKGTSSGTVEPPKPVDPTPAPSPTPTPDPEPPTHTHTYASTVTTSATCTTTGVRTYTCSCGSSYTESIPALGHDWNKGVITKEATCTENGVKKFTCTHDETHTKTETVTAIGHTAVKDEAVAATCTDTGKAEGSHCSVCNEVLVAQDTIPALGHSTTAVAAKESTCTEHGHDPYWQCSRCESLFSDEDATIQIQSPDQRDLKPHDEKPYDDEDPGYLTAGSTGGTMCSVCGTMISEPTYTYVSDQDLVNSFLNIQDYTRTGAPTAKTHGVLLSYLGSYTGTNIMNDLARFLNVIHTTGKVDILDYNGTVYTWEDLGNKGSNWGNEDKQSLVEVLVEIFRANPNISSIELTLIDENDNKNNTAFTIEFDARLVAIVGKLTDKGTVAYSTLKDAIDKADEGTIITLLNNVECVEGLIHEKVNLNGHALIHDTTGDVCEAVEPSLSHPGNSAGHKCTRCNYSDVIRIEQISIETFVDKLPNNFNGQISDLSDGVELSYLGSYNLEMISQDIYSLLISIKTIGKVDSISYDKFSYSSTVDGTAWTGENGNLPFVMKEDYMASLVQPETTLGKWTFSTSLEGFNFMIKINAHLPVSVGTEESLTYYSTLEMAINNFLNGSEKGITIYLKDDISGPGFSIPEYTLSTDTVFRSIGINLNNHEYRIITSDDTPDSTGLFVGKNNLLGFTDGSIILENNYSNMESAIDNYGYLTVSDLTIRTEMGSGLSCKTIVSNNGDFHINGNTKISAAPGGIAISVGSDKTNEGMANLHITNSDGVIAGDIEYTSKTSEQDHDWNIISITSGGLDGTLVIIGDESVSITLGINVSVVLSSGYTVQDNSVIRISEYGAMVENRYYIDLNSAVAAATAGQVVVMLKDSTCVDTKGITISENDHTLIHEEIIDEAIPATCTKEGRAEGKHCNCGKINVIPTAIPATGHTEETIHGKEATCTETGLTDGSKCSVCGEILVEQTTIETIDHMGTDASRIPPKIGIEGRKAGIICKMCGVILEGCEKIDPLVGGYAYVNGDYATIKGDEGSSIVSIDFSNATFILQDIDDLPRSYMLQIEIQIICSSEMSETAKITNSLSDDRTYSLVRDITEEVDGKYLIKTNLTIDFLRIDHEDDAGMPPMDFDLYFDWNDDGTVDQEFHIIYDTKTITLKDTKRNLIYENGTYIQNIICDGVGFDTLPEAVKYVLENNTFEPITILKDITGPSVSIPDSERKTSDVNDNPEKMIVIDLNGHSYLIDNSMNSSNNTTGLYIGKNNHVQLINGSFTCTSVDNELQYLIENHGELGISMFKLTGTYGNSLTSKYIINNYGKLTVMHQTIISTNSGNAALRTQCDNDNNSPIVKIGPNVTIVGDIEYNHIDDNIGICGTLEIIDSNCYGTLKITGNNPSNINLDGLTSISLQGALESEYVAKIDETGYLTLEDAIIVGNGKTIVLMNSVEGDFCINNSITLDLNGYTILGSITVDGSNCSLTIIDSTENGSIMNDNGNGAILIFNEATVNINGGSVVNEHGVTIWNGRWNDDMKEFMKGGNLTIDGDVEILSQEFCIDTCAGGHTKIVSGTFTSNDNAVLGTNGNKTDSNNKYLLEVDGGTFYGYIQTPGYIASGMYICNHGDVKLTGGTFNITNGCGITLRSGNLEISDNVKFNIIGNSKVAGKVGDKNIPIPGGYDIVKDDSDPMYPSGLSTLRYDGSKFNILTINTYQIDEIEGNLTRSLYGVSEQLNTYGLSVNITYNGTVNKTATNFTFDDEPLTIDSNMVTVKFFDKSKDVSITVRDDNYSAGSESYPTIGDAIEKVESADTIILTNDFTESIIKVNKDVTIDLNGHTLRIVPQIIGMDHGILVDGCTLTLTDSSTNNSGKVISNCYGVYILDNGRIILNNISIESDYACLTGNNTTGDMNFEINNSNLTSKLSEAIYMPGQMECTIKGSTLNGGISARMGQITIDNSTINGMTSEQIADPFETYWNWSGSAWIGDAIYVWGGTYTSNNANGNSCNITISGNSTINGNAHRAITVYDIANKYDQNIMISIGDGVTITGSVIIDKTEKQEAGKTVSITITGHEYTTIPEDTIQ